MVSTPELNPLADQLGRMIFVGVPAQSTAQAPAQDNDDAPLVEKAELWRTITARLREAREELCRMSQKEAARLLGVSLRFLQRYEDPMAEVKSTEPVFMTRASELYDVSMDWLYGRTDDWERCSRAHRERHAQLFTLRQIAINHAEQMEHFRRLYDWHEAEIKNLECIVEQTRAAIEEAEWLTSRKGFEDMRGSAPVARSLHLLRELHRKTVLQLERERRGIAFHRPGDAALAELRGAGD